MKEPNETNEKEENDFTFAEKIEDIMGEEKPNQKPKYKINYERFEKILPRNVVTEKEVEDFLYSCVEEHNKRQRMKELSR